jgi:hypothetical protein
VRSSGTLSHISWKSMGITTLQLFLEPTYVYTEMQNTVVSGI